jgi:integrase
MKRRGNREGGEPRRRKDGRWQADYTGADGRRHSVIASRVTECRTRLRTALRHADDGLSPTDGRLTVSAWLDTWMRDHVRGGTKPRRPRTADGYDPICRLHLKPHLGRIPLARLTPEHVAAALDAIASQPDAGRTTARHAYTVFHTAVARAVRSRKVGTNVVDLVDKPAAVYREIDPWTPAEVDRFLDAVGSDRYGPLYAFAIGSGCRQGEILGLRWNEVDLVAGTVRVAGQLSRDRQLAEVKTERGRRTFGLPELALYALKAQRVQQARDRLAAGSHWQDDGYVFTMRDGRPVGWRSLDAAFVRAQARAGVRRQRFHDMRHSFATLLLDAGEEVAVISKMLGHADYSTTVDVYSHLSRERSRVAAARIDGLLKRRQFSEETAS